MINKNKLFFHRIKKKKTIYVHTKYYILYTHTYYTNTSMYMQNTYILLFKCMKIKY